MGALALYDVKTALLILINAAGNRSRPDFHKPAAGPSAPSEFGDWEMPMTMQSDHHAHRLSDNPAAQLALLATAVILLIAIGWFYFQ